MNNHENYSLSSITIMELIILLILIVNHANS